MHGFGNQDSEITSADSETGRAVSEVRIWKLIARIRKPQIADSETLEVESADSDN